MTPAAAARSARVARANISLTLFSLHTHFVPAGLIYAAAGIAPPHASRPKHGHQPRPQLPAPEGAGLPRLDDLGHTSFTHAIFSPFHREPPDGWATGATCAEAIYSRDARCAMLPAARQAAGQRCRRRCRHSAASLAPAKMPAGGCRRRHAAPRPPTSISLDRRCHFSGIEISTSLALPGFTSAPILLIHGFRLRNEMPKPRGMHAHAHFERARLMLLLRDDWHFTPFSRSGLEAARWRSASTLLLRRRLLMHFIYH